MKRNKIISVGSFDSINIEILSKSISIMIKEDIKFLLVGDKTKIKRSFNKFNLKKKINIVNNFENYKKKMINVYNTDNLKKKYSSEILNDLSHSYNLAVITKSDLVTLPINKYEVKEKINNFNGVTEFLGKLNNSKTFMIMKGDLFSIVPLTTHIPLKKVSKIFLKQLNYLEILLGYLIKNQLEYKNIIFLGLNPHSGEDGTIGDEERILKSKIKILQKKFQNFKFIGPLSADSAFKNIKKNSLYISGFHDQALIPFKILNNNQINYTIGLNIRRYSPAHGTAKDIKNKNKAEIESFLECMKH